MDKIERQRRHDERWQHAVLDGMARVLDVLHDVSDGIQRMSEAVSRPTADAPRELSVNLPQLLSINDVAALLGVSPSVVRSWRATGGAPIATRIGRRVFFRRNDVESWLQQQREVVEERTRLWRDTHLPGRIGSNVPRSSQREQRAYCDGSHSEPLAASRYTGRAICRVCRDDVIVNKDGRIRKHFPRSW